MAAPIDSALLFENQEGARRPDPSHLVTQTEEPLDSWFQERQQRLLVDALYASWPGPGEGRAFVAGANVGIFETDARGNPGIAPDALLSLDARPAKLNESKSYFLWDHGKPPDVVVEIVSGREGDELSHKVRRYEKLRIAHYLVFDPDHYLTSSELHHFVLHGAAYVANDSLVLEEVGLGVTLWTGEYEGMNARWLRWTLLDGTLLATGAERASTAEERASTAEERASTAEARAALLAEKLRAAGIDPGDL